MLTMTEPEVVDTTTDAALTERWVRTVRESHPHFPRAMLELALAIGALPTTQALMEACGFDARMAESKRRQFEVEVLAPGDYAALFAAEDALASAELRLYAYEEAVQALQARHAEVAQAIQALTADRLRQVRPELQAQLQQEAAVLDEERVTLQRQYLDLVGGRDAYGMTYSDVGAPLRREVATCAAEVERASTALREAVKQHVLAVDEDYYQEACATLAGEGGVSVLHIIRWCRVIVDPQLTAMGLEPNWERGSVRIKEQLSRRIHAA